MYEQSRSFFFGLARVRIFSCFHFLKHAQISPGTLGIDLIFGLENIIQKLESA